MKPTIPNLEPLVGLGIDPKTGLPMKIGGASPVYLKNNVTQLLSVVDEQDAVRRFKWEGLPNGITSDLIERMLYYKYQVAMFKMYDGKFYVLPYSLAGAIDCYGRWRVITPVPFSGGNTEDEKPWVKGLLKNVVYDEDEDPEADDAAVIIRDYVNGISQMATPRQMLNKPLLEVEAECLPFLRTALINSTGVAGVRVANEDESENILATSRALENAALTGNPYVPVIGGLEFQQMTEGNVALPECFLQTMQSIDNLRLQVLGIDNGGIFQKKAHELQSEQDMNAGSDNIAMQDALELRQAAAEQMNRVFGLNVTVTKAIEEQDAEVEETDDEEVSDDAAV